MGAPPQFYSANFEWQQANITKAAAFVWAVEGDGGKGEKAAIILEQIAIDFNYSNFAGLLELLDDDVHIAEAMQGYCAAFDILAGTGYLFGQRLIDVRDRLESMVNNCWNLFMVDWYVYRDVLSFANHFTKIATAFGTAAITLNQSQYAGQWIDLAMARGTRKLFEFCKGEEGAFVEGPSYHVYAAVQHIPFFIQYDRFTAGQSATFYSRRCDFFGRNCSYNPVFVNNPLDDPRLYEMAMWTVNIRMPDGTGPPFDDSFIIGNINGLLAGALQDQYLAWDWLNAPGAPYYSIYCADLAVDLITTFDDTIIPAQPAWGPSVVYPVDGYAVFRTDWSEDSPYALFLAENGKTRVNNVGHEHADNLSFIYWYDGKMLAIDSGYIRWEEHHKVRFGIDHNVIAIDGKGPPAQIIFGIGSVDAYIHQYETEQSPGFVVGSTKFSETEWTRGFFFFQDFVMIGDVLDSDTSHDYRFLLHGNGGGDTGGSFQLQGNGAGWELDGVTLDLVLSATSDITHDNYLDDHGWVWNQAHTHEVYSGEIFNADKGGFAAALVPNAAKTAVTASPLAMGPLCAGMEAASGGENYYMLVDSGAPACGITAGETLEVKNGAAWIDPDLNRAVVFGSDVAFYVNGRQAARQTNGKSMEVEWGQGWVVIEPDNGEDNELFVELFMPWADVKGACVEQVRITPKFAWIKLDGVCEVEVVYQVYDKYKFW